MDNTNNNNKKESSQLWEPVVLVFCLFFFNYLDGFIRLCQISVADFWSWLWYAASLVVSCGIPDQGSNLGPLYWECLFKKICGSFPFLSLPFVFSFLAQVSPSSSLVLLSLTSVSFSLSPFWLPPTPHCHTTSCWFSISPSLCISMACFWTVSVFLLVSLDSLIVYRDTKAPTMRSESSGWAAPFTPQLWPLLWYRQPAGPFDGFQWTCLR